MSSHQTPPESAAVECAAHTVGTPEYRRRHISMLWTAQLWHEAIYVGFVATVFCLLGYAIIGAVAP